MCKILSPSGSVKNVTLSNGVLKWYHSFSHAFWGEGRGTLFRKFDSASLSFSMLVRGHKSENDTVCCRKSTKGVVVIGIQHDLRVDRQKSRLVRFMVFEVKGVKSRINDAPRSKV